jgi:hypothetical protein
MSAGQFLPSRVSLGLLVMGSLTVTTIPARALIFIHSADSAFNNSAPDGALAGSGWQFQGAWGGLLGTPVAPNFFLTAKHGGGSVGAAFSYQGSGYGTAAKFDHPTADLTLWQVAGTFPTYAPIYTGSDEVGKGLVVFGRSATRGDEVTVSGASVTDLRGWLWNGTGGGIQRWGENAVDATTTYAGADYLVAGFSRTGGANEATLAGGDSGGGVFIQEAGIWKLAGINYGVEAEFRSTAGGPTFLAAIFDAGGLYADTGSGFALMDDAAGDLEASFYSTRVSSYAGWIQDITEVPEPSPAPVALGLGLVALACTRRLKTGR